MTNFNEHALEMSIMELFQDEEYTYINGESIIRNKSDVLLADDLRKYLHDHYSSEGISDSEIDGIVLSLRNISELYMMLTKQCINVYAMALSLIVKTDHKKICISASLTLKLPKTIYLRS